tara:strand:+ start:234 stop:656 length:423 start_codon:yes stop_codon:yes gene_type:complete
MRFIIAFMFLICSCNQGTSVKKEDLSKKINNSNVFFKNINEGDTLVSPFKVEMGVSGLRIKPAGKLEPGTGHHHILLNRLFMNYGDIIPMDEQHLHYGKGDTVVILNLPSGPHQLTLQFANGMHMSYGEQFSKTVNIYVK